MKRKIASTLLILLFLMATACAQNKVHNNISVRTGFAQPFAKFADKSMEAQSSFARMGWNIESDYMLYWNRIGLCAGAGYASMDFDQAAYASEYIRILGEGGELTLNTGSYRVLKTTAGLVIKGPEFEFSQVYFLLQAGMAQSTHPQIEVTHSIWGLINYTEESSVWHSLSSVGCILKSDFSEKFGLTFSYNASFSKPWFSDEGSMAGGFYLPVRYHTFNMGIVIML